MLCTVDGLIRRWSAIAIAIFTLKRKHDCEAKMRALDNDECITKMML